MASRTTVTLVDDLDGSAADETVPFGLDGSEYEIDLSSGHAEELRGAIERYVVAARRTGGRRSTASGAGARAQKPANGASRERNQEIRAWAASNGATLADLGRIPSYVVEAFDAGDASRLSGSDGGDSAGSDIPPAPDVEQDTATDGVEQSRGRDGLTAAEREAIREWAVNEGIEVKARGILKKDLIANYEAWSARQN